MQDNEYDPVEFRNDIPNAAIYNTRDNKLMMLRFDTDGEYLNVKECELSEDFNHGDNQLPVLTYNQICFAKVAYEFDLDEDDGIMELSLYEVVSLHSDGVDICIEDTVESNIQFMGEMYIEHIDEFYSF